MELHAAVWIARSAVELAKNISARRIQLYRGFVLCQRIEKRQHPSDMNA